MNAFIDYSARTVPVTAQAVWFALFRETKPNGVATISQGHIAKLIGASRRTVTRTIQTLEDAGLLTVVKQGKLGGSSSIYRVHGTPNEKQ